MTYDFSKTVLVAFYNYALTSVVGANLVLILRLSYAYCNWAELKVIRLIDWEYF